MIKTREELLMALTEASELEHGLACQYLFAVYSMKPPNDPTLTASQKAKLNQWRLKIVRIAKEEMEHLATVTNLLSAIGGAPHFQRPNFPQPPKFYPPDIPFELERFGDDSLSRFVRFEQNEKAPGPEAALAPEEISYKHVGELYAEIIEAFQTLPEAQLFLNTASQDVDLIGGPVHPDRADNRDQAVAALTSLMAEGEAYEDPTEYSHYHVFFGVLSELRAEVAANPSFDPARKVLKNPLTRTHRGVTGGNLITNLDTRAAVELFNCLYTSMILVFQQYFAFGGESAEQREVLNGALIDLMKFVIKPLALLLTGLPAIEGEDDGETAGPSFEFYGQYRLSAIPKVAWAVIIEKLTQEIDDATTLAAKYAATPTGDPGFGGVVTSVTMVRDNLQAAKPN
ncbi:ferritin-like domain-containing protein [Paludisphaera rhizosphaerae]|uniref:ferritin-like domain-containing protein n=1 Tax=Paludisphaera rhizosphaerae TaxID=2711216 RepID=UPI0013EAD355|nr:ferritin-like domain-containing protein [Paludisphaera rhizosphaerae]